MDKHTEDFMQFFEDSEKELAEEIKRQEGFIKAVEESVLKIIYEIHPDYGEVPKNIKTRISKDLHQAAVEINEYLDYAISELYNSNPYQGEISPVGEISEDRVLLKKCFEKSKELVIEYFPEIYEANSEVLRMLNLTCFVAMAEFVEGFNFLCIDYLEYFYEED